MTEQNKQSYDVLTTKEPSIVHLLLARQKVIQTILGNCERLTTQTFINEQILALLVEVTEALGETPWKPWKKNQQLDVQNFKKELIDCQIFLFNLILAAEMDADEFLLLLITKMNKNIERHQSGY